MDDCWRDGDSLPGYLDIKAVYILLLESCAGLSFFPFQLEAVVSAACTALSCRLRSQRGSGGRDVHRAVDAERRGGQVY